MWQCGWRMSAVLNKKKRISGQSSFSKVSGKLQNYNKLGLPTLRKKEKTVEDWEKNILGANI